MNEYERQRSRVKSIKQMYPLGTCIELISMNDPYPSVPSGTRGETEKMNKMEFIEYIRENFTISGEAYRLISNILDYIKSHTMDENEQYIMACDLLDGTIGLNDNELRKICL